MGETNISIQTHLVSPSLSELSFTNLNHPISNGHLNYLHTGLHVQFTTAWALCIVVVVQSLSRVWLFATPWTAACQAPLSFTISRTLLKFMSTELVMPSNHLIFCHPLLILSPIFPMSWLITSGGQNIGVSASASVLSMNIQGWFPLGLTSLIQTIKVMKKTHQTSPKPQTTDWSGA